jgi:hypothetical protein
MRYLALAILLSVPAAAADDLDEAARKRAVQKGLAYLEGHLFKLPESAGTPRKPFTTAVAGLCFLMDHRTRTGPDRIVRVRDYLLAYVERVAQQSADPKNLPPRHGLASSSYLVQYTWPVAAAGLFFAELEARGRFRNKKAIRTILRILIEAQQRNGGWGHGRIHKGNKDPLAEKFGQLGGGYPDTLCSSSNVVAITVGVLDALGHDAGDAVDRARAYYRSARLSNGGFPYDPSQRSSGFAKTNVGRTAGSIYAWHCLGMPRDRDFAGSVDYLMKEFAWIPEGHGSPCLNMMHGALACHMLGKKTWRRFRRAFEPRMLAKQTEAGCLECICESKAFGVTCDTKKAFAGFLGAGQKTYTTALHTFVLMLEHDNLKALKKRKPGATITKGERGR